MKKANPDEFILPFFNIFKAFRKKLEGFSEASFNITEVGALHFIKTKGKVSMKELADFLEITPPSTTALTDKMIKLNILKRGYDKKDRRSIIISLNREGLKLLKKARREKIKTTKEILSRINNEERDQLCSIFKKMFKE